MLSIRVIFSMLLIGLTSLAACQPTPPSTPIPPSAEPSNIQADPNPEPELSQRSGPISDAEATEMMYALLERDTLAQELIILRIIEEKDTRFTAVLIEIMRATQVGLLPYQTEFLAFALEEITGESIGNDWAGWVIWYGGTDLEPPDQFTTWKGALFSGIDPGFAEFLQSDFPTTIRTEEIQWGGVQIDGIPALDQSPMISAEAADYLDPGDAVFGLSINGDHRAYPLRIMDWHEMANDVVGGVPVSIAYCTLCGAAVAYDGRGSDGQPYDFGSSGFLFRSNKLMYDRQTRTLWNQLTGKPVLGPLVDRDVQLDILPIVLTTWEDWQATHPDTQVLSLDTGWTRPYETGAAYGEYFQSEETMFPVWTRGELLDQKDQVYAIQIEGRPKAYPIERLIQEQVVNDTHANQALVLISAEEAITLNGFHHRSGLVNYSPGAEVRAYERADFTFSPGETEDEVEDQHGMVWRVTEEALLAASGERLERLPGHLAFWFGWFAFFPHTEVYGVDR